MRIFATFLAVASLSLPFAVQPAAAQQQVSPALSVSLPDGVTSSDFGKRNLRTIAVQTLLDRSRHSPGVVDGYTGGNTSRANRAYRRAHDLGSSGSIDQQLIRSLVQSEGGDVFRTYTIAADDVNGPFSDIPASFTAKAKLDRLGCQSPRELIAEKFHMDQSFLAALNLGVNFSNAGTNIHKRQCDRQG